MPSPVLRPADLVTEPEPYILDLGMDFLPVRAAKPKVATSDRRGEGGVDPFAQRLAMAMSTTPVLVDELITWG